MTVGNSHLQYAYDGLGNRLSRTENFFETRYIIDPNGTLPNVIAETDSAGNIQDYYIYGLGLVYKLMPNGSTYTYHFDSRGSTIAMTDGTGLFVNEYLCGPYGERVGAVEAVANPFGYVGKYGVMEEGNGLKFMRARYYDETTGRFLNKDLIPGDISTPQSLNRYAYVQNNPVNWIDPLGLWDWGFGGTAGPWTFSWDSSHPFNTKVEWTVPGIGGGFTICWDHPYKGDPCKEKDIPKTPFNVNVGMGRWSGVSTDGDKFCINIGPSISLSPIGISSGGYH